MGAARYGGCWNGPSVRLVYTSASPSLAALERLVHTFSVRGLAGLWVHTLSFEENESLYLPPDELPEGWDRKPVPPDWHEAPLKATQLIGNDWVGRRASLALRVPSAVVGGEFNYLINPEHPAFERAERGPPQPFRFDARLANLVAAAEGPGGR